MWLNTVKIFLSPRQLSKRRAPSCGYSFNSKSFCPLADGERVLKASLVLRECHLSPEVTRFTSTCAPVAVLSAPPPSGCPSQLTQFLCAAAGASQETRHSQGSHALTGTRWSLLATSEPEVNSQPSVTNKSGLKSQPTSNMLG